MTRAEQTRPVAASVGAMLENQTPLGAFVASPDFSQYRYCWLRDGAFTAYALDRSGESGAAGRFHIWVLAALDRLGASMERSVARRSEQQEPDRVDLPPARFALDGSIVADDWPNFQIDGYATWLWSLREHLLAEGESGCPPELAGAVDLVGRYVAAFALDPCFDVWEMNGSEVHTSTLACIYGGLRAAADLIDAPYIAQRAEEVRSYVLGACVDDGRFGKSTSNSEVDASTLWLSVPFALVEPDDRRLAKTVAAIESALRFEGGVRRFESDTYFGGGAWPVLTATLGWHFAALGERARAEEPLRWIECRLDEAGHLAEQYGGERRDPTMHAEWVERWGVPAKQLVWSHAMHAVLAAAAGRQDDADPGGRERARRSSLAGASAEGGGEGGGP